jgi:hypothetical protein
MFCSTPDRSKENQKIMKKLSVDLEEEDWHLPPIISFHNDSSGQFGSLVFLGGSAFNLQLAAASWGELFLSRRWHPLVLPHSSTNSTNTNQQKWLKVRSNPRSQQPQRRNHPAGGRRLWAQRREQERSRRKNRSSSEVRK